MKILNRSILEYVISISFFVILIIGLVVFLTLRFIHGNIYQIYNDKEVLIELSPKINKKLDKLTDLEGIHTSFNSINLTNNGTRKKYQIYISPISNNEKEIRLSFDNSIIRYLSSFEKINNKYLIYESDIKNGYSALHKIRIWQDKLSSADNIKTNFKISVKVEE